MADYADPDVLVSTDWVAEHRPFTLARDTEAEEMLAEILPDVELVDVDASAEWAALYGLRVPVLTIDDRVVLEGRFTEAAVATLFMG